MKNIHVLLVIQLTSIVFFILQLGCKRDRPLQTDLASLVVLTTPRSHSLSRSLSHMSSIFDCASYLTFGCKH